MQHPQREMNIREAQREVRRVYGGGFPGLLISSLVWFVSATLGSFVSWEAAMWALVVGGVCIFFGLELLLRVIGHDAALSPTNPLNPLVMQTAFLLPLLLPLIAAAFQFREDWLYPAFMVALGAHFVPFMFLFGLWHFGALGLLLAGSAIVFGLSTADDFVVAGWYGGIVQLLFALISLSAVRQEKLS